MELNKFVGNKIREYREEFGISQETLAARLKTTRQTISRYETGERKANQDVLYQLAQIFNKQIDAFFPPRSTDDSKNDRLMTIAAHLDDDVTDEEMREILNYIEFKKLQRRE
ncbi:helix-turn-helix transcriptional regulator [Listeria ilorinensis]|uniref:helix-turn-helix transcriptional regulator n=1 Tax=Listeria ilorinensis TaxID=2867439 RepID=UPI001EF559CB|nr:helix-turn-helix transcriptional regulator [Listeria ilorinensis]